MPGAFKTASALANGEETAALAIPRRARDVARGLQSPPSLEAAVVDKGSECGPEDCDFGGERYRHVPVFRVDTAHPPLISLPGTIFKTGYDIPVLYAAVKKTITIGDKALEISGSGSEVRTAQLGAGEYAVDDVATTVVGWSGNKGCGVPGHAEGGAWI